MKNQTLQTNQSNSTKPNDTFAGVGEIHNALVGIPPCQKVQTLNPTSLTVEQIVLMSKEAIQKDIFKGVKFSKIIQKYKQLETAIHNTKNQYAPFMLNVNELAKIGIYAISEWTEDENRSYIVLKPYRIEYELLRKYFTDRLVVNEVC